MQVNFFRTFKHRYWLILLAIAPFFVQNCAKYKDAPFVKIDTFTKKYCNNNRAVNYNWGFPGVLDNTTCIFPADVFKGNYIFYDSLQDANGIFLPTTNFNLNITKQTDTTIFISGLCTNALIIKAHATKNLRFTLDSTVTQGQLFCSNIDTVNGLAILQTFGDSTFVFSYNIITPTGLQIHKGTVKKN